MEFIPLGLRYLERVGVHLLNITLVLPMPFLAFPLVFDDPMFLYMGRSKGGFGLLIALRYYASPSSSEDHHPNRADIQRWRLTCSCEDLLEIKQYPRRSQTLARKTVMSGTTIMMAFCCTSLILKKVWDVQ